MTASGHDDKQAVGGKIWRDISVRLVARVAATGLQAVFLLLLARGLGPFAFGRLSVALSATLLIGAGLGFGAATRALRILAEDNAAQALGALALLRVGGSVVGLAVGVAICMTIFRIPLAPALVGALLASSDQIAEFAQSRLSGTQQNGPASAVVVGHRAVQALVLILVGATSASAWTSGAVAAFSGLALTLPLSGVRRGVDLAEIRAVARSSVGYLWSSLSSNLNQLEPVVLRPFATSDLIGFFSVAGRLANPLTILAAAAQAIAIPEMAASKSARRRSRALTFIVGGCLYGLVLIAASPVIVWVASGLLGSEYQGARPFLYAIVFAAALSSVAQMFQAVLLVEGRPGVAAWCVGSGTLLSLAGLAGLAAAGHQSSIWICAPTVQLAILIALAVPALRGTTLHSAKEKFDVA